MLIKKNFNNVLISIYAKINKIPKDKIYFLYLNNDKDISGYTCNESGYIGEWKIRAHK